jgi:NAD(P)-dependent dehydrogenase (short-subunit alcohol dehydrogenase family)
LCPSARTEPEPGDGAAPVAVVTGAGSGIGRAVAARLARDGYRTALLGRRLERLRPVAEEIEGSGGEALCIAVDVRDAEAVAAAFAAVVEDWGRVDLLFNNAGVFGPGERLPEYPLDGWRETIATNLTGAFHCAREAFRIMERQQPRGGRIVNNGSLSAQTPRPNAVGYTVSKHGITGLSKAISLEGRDRDVACTQIDIGNAATELTAGIAEGALQPDGSRRPEATIDVAAVAEGVAYVASLPLEATVPFMTVMAAEMPFAGRG